MRAAGCTRPAPHRRAGTGATRAPCPRSGKEERKGTRNWGSGETNINSLPDGWAKQSKLFVSTKMDFAEGLKSRNSGSEYKAAPLFTVSIPEQPSHRRCGTAARSVRSGRHPMLRYSVQILVGEPDLSSFVARLFER